jgi:hypothetical protein
MTSSSGGQRRALRTISLGSEKVGGHATGRAFARPAGFCPPYALAVAIAHRIYLLIDPLASNRDAPILGDATFLETVNRHRRKVERFALVGRG